MKKICCISDTHNRHFDIKLPDGDILVHAGDATGRGTLPEIIAFSDWMKEQPYKHKIFCAGNHDFYCEKYSQTTKELFERKGIHYLQDSAVIIDGVKFYGSPNTPRFFDWAFNVDRGEPLKKVWSKIPHDTNVLITHGPPYGIMDKTVGGENVGCEELRKRIESLPNLKLHVFGHIHCGYGQEEINGVKFVNAAICTESYYASNLPVLIDLE